MGILSWIVIGGIAGWLTGWVMKGHGFGPLVNILEGIIGGLIGGWLAGLIFNLPNSMTSINLTSLLFAFLGGVVLMLVIRLLRRQ